MLIFFLISIPRLTVFGNVNIVVNTIQHDAGLGRTEVLPMKLQSQRKYFAKSSPCLVLQCFSILLLGKYFLRTWDSTNISNCLSYPNINSFLFPLIYYHFCMPATFTQPLKSQTWDWPHNIKCSFNSKTLLLSPVSWNSHQCSCL